MMTLAALATKFLERPGLAKSTLRSYQSTIIPLLKEYGRWSIEIIDRQVLMEYLNHLTDVSYTTHHRHQAVITALFSFADTVGETLLNIKTPILPCITWKGRITLSV